MANGLLVLTGRTDVSLTEAVASINKFAANVYVQLSLAKRNYTLGSVGGTRVGVCLRYAVEQQAIASAVLFQVVHLVGEENISRRAPVMINYSSLTTSVLKISDAVFQP